MYSSVDRLRIFLQLATYIVVHNHMRYNFSSLSASELNEIYLAKMRNAIAIDNTAKINIEIINAGLIL